MGRSSYLGKTKEKQLNKSKAGTENPIYLLQQDRNDTAMTTKQTIAIGSSNNIKQKKGEIQRLRF